MCLGCILGGQHQSASESDNLEYARWTVGSSAYHTQPAEGHLNSLSMISGLKKLLRVGNCVVQKVLKAHVALFLQRGSLVVELWWVFSDS